MLTDRLLRLVGALLAVAVILDALFWHSGWLDVSAALMLLVLLFVETRKLPPRR